MSKVKIIDTSKSVNVSTSGCIGWELCIICKEQKSECPQCPAQTKRSGYQSFTYNPSGFVNLEDVTT